MKYTAVIFASIVILLLSFHSCGRKMPLPHVESSPESFGANDTTYNLTGVWNKETIGYQPTKPFTPVDITISDDGYIFVADSANDKIVTLNESGALVTIENLANIPPISAPSGIDIDAKLNLLIVNGTNTVYSWNQYLNNIGISAYLVGRSNKPNLIFSGDPELIESIVDSIYSRDLGASDLIFANDAAFIDSLLDIHPFYVDGDENSQFHDVAFGPSNENTVFLTDKGNNRILKLNIVTNGFVISDNGFNRTFTGIAAKNIATYGSGAGTVDNPRGIITDDDGNIYFTQLGGNFFVQKLKLQGNQYISAFTLYEHTIMDLNRFVGPYNIALGKDDAIFVLDTEDGTVQKFFNKGVKAGELVNLGKKGLVEVVFNRPLGIAVSDKDIVYIAETGNHKIQRYQSSDSESDLPVEQP